MLYFLPFVKMDGKEAEELVGLVRAICERSGFIPYITANTISETVLEFVISIAFDQHREGKVRLAQECMEELQERFAALGYYPYRNGIQLMKYIVDEKDPFWCTVRD